jgi:nitrogenase subunit NifH
MMNETMTPMKTRSEQEAERKAMVMEAVPAIVNIDKSRVVRVYSGRPGCGCGCRGNYSDNKSAITRVLNAMKANVCYADRAGVMANDVLHDEDGVTEIAFVETDTRYYWAYLR